MPKKKQAEFDLNDKKHPCYEPADHYLTLVENERQIKKEKSEAMKELLKSMKEHDTPVIKVRGHALKRQVKEATETVKVD